MISGSCSEQHPELLQRLHVFNSGEDFNNEKLNKKGNAEVYFSEGVGNAFFEEGVTSDFTSRS